MAENFTGRNHTVYQHRLRNQWHSVDDSGMNPLKDHEYIQLIID